MKKIIAKLAIIATLVGGFTFVGGPAFAEKAHAGKAVSCRLIDAGPGRIMYGLSSSGRYATSCYWDYDWMEETFLGYRDGWYTQNFRNVRCDAVFRVGC